MLKLIIAFFLVSAVPYCSKCVDNGDSCADTFAFNIVDATSGNNLVFGSNPIYNQDSVYLTTTIPGYSGKMSHSLNGKFESALLIPVDTFFLRLSPNDTDTLIMKYDFVKSKCCTNDRYGRVSEIFFNGSKVRKEGDIYILRK
jgi:hypothetical protein